MKKSQTVGDWMTPCPHTIGQEQTLEVAHEQMRRLAIRHLPVLHGGRLVGVLSSRDLDFLETLRDVDPKRVTVEEAMSQSPYTVSADAPLDRVATEMAEHRYGCALIVEGSKVTGVFTTVDGLRALAACLQGGTS